MAAAQRSEQALGDNIEQLDDRRTGLGDRRRSEAADARHARAARAGAHRTAHAEIRTALVPQDGRHPPDYPRILRGTARAMQMGVDVARPAIEAWRISSTASSSRNSGGRACGGWIFGGRPEMGGGANGAMDPPAPETAGPPPDFDIEAARNDPARGSPAAVVATLDPRAPVRYRALRSAAGGPPPQAPQQLSEHSTARPAFAGDAGQRRVAAGGPDRPANPLAGGDGSATCRRWRASPP